MDNNKAYKLSIKGVRDLSGNIITEKTEKQLGVKPCWKASEGYATFQGKFGWWYEQFNPDNVQVYNNRRDIIRSPRYWLINYYPEPDGSKWLAHHADTSITKNGMTAGRTFRAVHTWMVPVHGTVQITGTPRASAGKDQVRVQILYNPAGTCLPKDDTVLWDWQTLKDGSAKHSVTAKVKQGGVIRFITDRGTVRWDPEIRYIHQEQ
jgi:hypothetical protein